MRRRAGASILELLLVMFIMTILGGLVVDFILKTYNENAKVEAHSLAQRDLNLALDRVTKVVRSATSILEATPTTFKVRGYPQVSDTVPSEIHFFLNTSSATGVSYSVTPPSGSAPDYTYNPADAVTFTLVSKVGNSTSQPLFRYYDENNDLLSAPINLGSIKLVEFSPQVLDSSGKLTQPIEVSTKVSLRNLKTNL